MVRQWQDELEAKFGLSFTIVDREYLAALQPGARLRSRIRGLQGRASSSRTRFADETYAAGLRDALGEFRAKAM